MILLNEIHRLAPVKSCIRTLGQGQTDGGGDKMQNVRLAISVLKS